MSVCAYVSMDMLTHKHAWKPEESVRCLLLSLSAYFF